MKINCSKAKKIDFVSYLKKQGFTPVKNTPNSVWFCSPFRNEKTPSFKVDITKNIWYDFGEGVGGTIIDFIQKINNCSIKQVLDTLNTNSFSFHQQPQKKQPPANTYSIKKITELTNPLLLNYLSTRKINIEFAKRFLFQVHYSFNAKKEYFGVGFMNDLGGLEIRNKYFKGCLGKKAITTINNNSGIISLFESWSDFLSYLTLKKIIPNENFIILNSTSLTQKIPELIKGYSKTKCFFDNDEAGNKALKHLQKKVSKELIDCRIHYKNYNDLNDYLMSKCT
ncbi:toprim domain-containing protein [Tenacibaculum soleae]|uniref:toprim domain-containing protein n=1 Tax=Tenacibaculum soleae TaxID=447689 RepID=UPI00159EF588|nr:toprim domain-containing protein [Tenacibaculum soleae]